MHSRSDKLLKIIGLYALSTLLLGLYFFMGESEAIQEILRLAQTARTDRELAIFALVGLVKYSLLISGISIPVILTYLLIREKKNASQ